MVQLKVKVGDKGQILIPKIFREKYGVNEGQSVSIEPIDEGLLIKGRPSSDEAISRLQEHVERIRDMRINGPKLGDLKKVYLEMEFEVFEEERV